MSDAWLENEQKQTINGIDSKFEDNFVAEKLVKEFQNSEFKKLDDSEQYLAILESRLRRIKKDPSVLEQLKEKREECFKNLLNENFTLDSELELNEEVKSHEIIRHLNPAQAQTIGETVHLINHDHLDQQKQEAEEEVE